MKLRSERSVASKEMLFYASCRHEEPKAANAANTVGNLVRGLRDRLGSPNDHNGGPAMDDHQ